MKLFDTTSVEISSFFRRLIEVCPRRWKKFDRSQIEELAKKDPEISRIVSYVAELDRPSFFDAVLAFKIEQAEAERFNRIEMSLYRVCK